MKFTQGPWFVDSGNDSIENMIDCLSADVGTDREWVAVGLHDEDGYSESVAYCHPDNAPLIASAPDMHEILIKCREALFSESLCSVEKNALLAIYDAILLRIEMK